MLLDNSVDISCATSAPRFATQVTKDSSDAWTIASRHQTIAHLMVGKDIARANNHGAPVLEKLHSFYDFRDFLNRF